MAKIIITIPNSGGVTNHNNLLGLQGGDPSLNQFYHLTLNERDGLVDLLNNPIPEFAFGSGLRVDSGIVHLGIDISPGSVNPQGLMTVDTELLRTSSNYDTYSSISFVDESNFTDVTLTHSVNKVLNIDGTDYDFGSEIIQQVDKVTGSPILNQSIYTQEGNKGIYISEGSMVIEDTISETGASYAEDYSLNNLSNPRWITDKQYVDDKIIKDKPYYYPNWYTGIRIPVSIENGKAKYDYDVADNIILSSYIPYFISPTGIDTNDGLTELTPKKTITGCLTAGAKLIYLMSGTYLRDTLYASTTNLLGNDLILIGIGEVNITNGQGGLSWVLSTNNTYRATRSTVGNVIDFNFKDKYGFYKPLKQVATQALCEAESGTYFTDNVGVWVHTQDNRVPDSKVLPMVLLSNTITANAGKIYHENLNFYGIEMFFKGSINTTTLEVYMKNVHIPATKRAIGTAEFNNYRFEGVKTIILQQCTGIESTEDVFNYHNVLGVPNANVVELDCSAYNAGKESIAQNNQCSSAHDGIRILRLNGNYYGGNVQVIADVNVGTQTVMIGCELNSGTEQPNTVIFYGVNADLESCKLFGNKQIIAENTSVEGVTIRNSILEYSSTLGNVIIT